MVSTFTLKSLLTLPLVVLAVLSISTVTVSAARPLDSQKQPMVMLAPLAPRLHQQLDDDKSSATSSSCWESLFELQSCTGEVVLFFLNGETNLGPECCHAIRFIEVQCWPSMLDSLGYTAQETNILRDYCDASAVVAGSAPSLPEILSTEPTVDVSLDPLIHPLAPRHY